MRPNFSILPNYTDSVEKALMAEIIRRRHQNNVNTIDRPHSASKRRNILDIRLSIQLDSDILQDTNNEEDTPVIVLSGTVHIQNVLHNPTTTSQQQSSPAPIQLSILCTGVEHTVRITPQRKNRPEKIHHQDYVIWKKEFRINPDILAQGSTTDCKEGNDGVNSNHIGKGGQQNSSVSSTTIPFSIRLPYTNNITNPTSSGGHAVIPIPPYWENEESLIGQQAGGYEVYYQLFALLRQSSLSETGSQGESTNQTQNTARPMVIAKSPSLRLPDTISTPLRKPQTPKQHVAATVQKAKDCEIDAIAITIGVGLRIPIKKTFCGLWTLSEMETFQLMTTTARTRAVLHPGQAIQIQLNPDARDLFLSKKCTAVVVKFHELVRWSCEGMDLMNCQTFEICIFVVGGDSRNEDTARSKNVEDTATAPEKQTLVFQPPSNDDSSDLWTLTVPLPSDLQVSYTGRLIKCISHDVLISFLQRQGSDMTKEEVIATTSRIPFTMTL